jgi:hypothetical protein
MGLDQQLADFKAEFLRTAPAGRPALYEAKIEELRAGFALEAAVGVEARAPDFRLPDVRGNPVSLTDLLGRGPVVLTFYRRVVPLLQLQYPVASLPGDPAADSGFGRPTRSDLATAARAISCDRADG